MKVKQPTPMRDGDRRAGKRQPARAGQRRGTEAPPRKRRPNPEQRPVRPAPRTGPIPRPRSGPARPKSASQAKARAKARKAKAPKIVRPPLRERLLVRLASIELNPRALIARVPFVVLVIAALGLGLGVTLWLSTGSAERSYELGHARQTNQGLLQQKEALERDVLEAQAAPALAEAARNLGMIPSRDTAHLVQDPGGNWVVVGTPKPAEGVPPPPLNTPLPEEVPPPRAAPPAPRVVDPREVTVRIPQAGEPAVALPGAVPMPGVPPVEVPHLATGPQLPAPAPAAPAPPAPAEPVPAEPVPAEPAPAQAAPGAATQLAVPGVPIAPGPTTAVEQFTPAVDAAPAA
ncbi:hypothetical protein M1247_24750 [Mycobacterium sp. 21AC1]|uniref:hypothetical protein n=1 Tax=[Mycobacterium] appelbergii TaxID=2939269 RepID=UPI002938EA87|nr:hypothetical protein [Mycobacterium sp. 21AC1]MDV3128147.1 hypothetical protein [Mycobacterium sp. 21AC1]